MAVTIDRIPVYAAEIRGEEDGMIRISLVDSPAVMSDFLKFKEEKPQMFAITDEDKRLVNGVVMRADFPIYRNDGESEYYITFSPEVIRLMAEKYLRDSRQNSVDLQHDGEEVEGVEMVQWFIKDTQKGINPGGFSNIADGSLFAEFHITNDEVWQAVKDGTYKGFSLEGFFSLIPETDKEKVDEIVKNTDKFNHEENMKLKEKIARLVVKFAQVATDKGVLRYDGEEDLKVGDAVQLLDAEGKGIEAPDGDYALEDGTIIRVSQGVVTEILEPEGETEPTEASEEFSAKIKAAADTYNDKYTKIAAKVAEAGKNGYVVDAADDYAIVDIWNGENSQLYKVPVSWDEAGNVTLGEDWQKVVEQRVYEPISKEEKMEEVENPTNEGEETDTEAIVKIREEIDQLFKDRDVMRQEIDELKAKVAEKESEIEEMKKQSSGSPAHEEFNASIANPVTDKRMQRVNAMAEAIRQNKMNK